MHTKSFLIFVVLLSKLLWMIDRFGELIKFHFQLLPYLHIAVNISLLDYCCNFNHGIWQTVSLVLFYVVH